MSRPNTGSRPFRKTSPSAELVDTAKLRWRIERDYQELKQELGLGHFEGRGWRGFHHHATLCIAAYGFLISERETIPPCGPCFTTLFTELAVPDDYRPRGSAVAARASHPKLNRNHASTADRRARQKPCRDVHAAIPQSKHRRSEEICDAVRLVSRSFALPETSKIGAGSASLHRCSLGLALR